MSNYGAGVDRYNSTSRKIFDKHVDRMEHRRQRDLNDHRADMGAIVQRMIRLEDQLTQVLNEIEDLSQHVDRHCAELDTSRKGGNEGLE